MNTDNVTAQEVLEEINNNTTAFEMIVADLGISFPCSFEQAESICIAYYASLSHSRPAPKLSLVEQLGNEPVENLMERTAPVSWSDEESERHYLINKYMEDILVGTVVHIFVAYDLTATDHMFIKYEDAFEIISGWSDFAHNIQVVEVTQSEVQAEIARLQTLIN